MQIPDIHNLNNYEGCFDFNENAEKIMKLKIFPKKQQSPFLMKWQKASKFTIFKNLFEKFLINLDYVDYISMEDKEKIMEEKFNLISEMEKMGEFLNGKANIEHFIFLRSYGKIQENLEYHLDLKKEIKNLSESIINLEEELKNECMKVENPENNDNILASVNILKEEMKRLDENRKLLEEPIAKLNKIKKERDQEEADLSKTYQQLIDYYNANEITEAHLKGKSDYINELELKKNEVCKINEELEKDQAAIENQNRNLENKFNNLHKNIIKLDEDIREREGIINEQKAKFLKFGMESNIIEIDLFKQKKEIKEKENFLTELTNEKDGLLLNLKEYDNEKIENADEKKNFNALNLKKIYSMQKEIEITQEMNLNYHKIALENSRKEAKIAEKIKENEKLKENLSNARKRNVTFQKTSNFMWRRILLVILLTVLMVFFYKI